MSLKCCGSRLMDVVVDIAAIIKAEALWCHLEARVQRLKQGAWALCIAHDKEQHAAAALKAPEELAAWHQLFGLPLVLCASGHCAEAPGVCSV